MTVIVARAGWKYALWKATTSARVTFRTDASVVTRPYGCSAPYSVRAKTLAEIAVGWSFAWVSWTSVRARSRSSASSGKVGLSIMSAISASAGASLSASASKPRLPRSPPMLAPMLVPRSCCASESCSPVFVVVPSGRRAAVMPASPVLSAGSNW